MKIKNVSPSNQSIMCSKLKADAPTKYITIIGESTLTLDDETWKAQEHNFAAQLKSGILVVTEAPKLTKAEQEMSDAKELAKAEALVASKKKPVSTK